MFPFRLSFPFQLPFSITATLREQDVLQFVRRSHVQNKVLFLHLCFWWGWQIFFLSRTVISSTRRNKWKIVTLPIAVIPTRNDWEAIHDWLYIKQWKEREREKEREGREKRSRERLRNWRSLLLLPIHQNIFLHSPSLSFLHSRKFLSKAIAFVIIARPTFDLRAAFYVSGNADMTAKCRSFCSDSDNIGNL